MGVILYWYLRYAGKNKKEEVVGMMWRRENFSDVFGMFEKFGYTVPDIIGDGFAILDGIKRVKDGCLDDIDFQLKVIAHVLNYDSFDPSTWIFDRDIYQRMLKEFSHIDDICEFMLEVGKLLFKLQENFNRQPDEVKKEYSLVGELLRAGKRFRTIYYKVDGDTMEEKLKRLANLLDSLLIYGG